MSALQAFTKSKQGCSIVRRNVIRSIEENEAAILTSDSERKELLKLLSFLNCLEVAAGIFDDATFYL
jgi:hypothetical protein